MPGIRFDGVRKVFAGSRFSSNRAGAVEDVTFEVGEGELVVLLGPSGCGKTTLLRMVNRLIEPSAGTIYLGNQDIRAMSVTQLRRQIGYVIQQVGLFPHMTVAGNIATVPKLVGWDRKRIRARTDELLDLVALPPEEFRDRYPAQLSGGQQQRVGIARAMAADPGVLLMDEPFGAIDAITRADMQRELLNIQHKVRKTIIFVTHDVEEALLLADRIAVMREGKLVQYGRPIELLQSPEDTFVSTLLDTGDVFRQLSLVSVSELMQAPDGVAGGLQVHATDNVRSALSRLIAAGAERATVLDGSGAAVGTLTLERVMNRAETSS